MKTFIIIVNYNGWKDTIICLDDLKQKKWSNFEIILVDNCSSDISRSKIESYLAEKERTFIKNHFPDWKSIEQIKRKIPVHFLKSKSNNGFAAGNNIGIEFALNRTNGDFYIWLLNNDTVLDNNSLPELINYFKSDNYGLVGSKILNFDPPHEVQSLYGSFNKFCGSNKIISNVNSKKHLSYPIGASLFLSSEIIKKVGLLSEDYFLYHEEIDYSTRVLRNNLKIGVCNDSVVYHRQGSSTGSFKNKKKTNLFIEEYKHKGLLLFYRKYYKRYLFAAYLNLLLKSIKLMLKGELKNSKLILTVLINK